MADDAQVRMPLSCRVFRDVTCDPRTCKKSALSIFLRFPPPHQCHVPWSDSGLSYTKSLVLTA